ncbi:thiolase-like protein [Rhodofomes roseus]|uniref:Thiolase-like protein n=1 Tax=Rhodofomes roseus TaxID=34475 RepID=A0ABQ8K7B3_9APHY|nr:thiolase-like protein [Rhodofomes roseus]KAH9833093.1 thiolase-like protein [Rhodofomes roseus]
MDQEKQASNMKVVGERRLRRIMISEAVFMIWKLRCTRVIGHAEENWQHSNTAVKRQWISAINKRLEIDKEMTKKKYGRSAIAKNTILATWTNTLHEETDLPEDWVNINGFLILGTGINSSGSLAPVNAPVASAQQDAMLRAFAQAQRSPKEVDFIELHATGTSSGDPTEANWVGVQFRRDAEVLVGSVKGNVGHTEITSFLSSLCKVCHIIKHGVIPPTVNCTIPNPAIRWAEHNMRVPVAPEELRIRSPSGRALIAMSSSGIGGANGHCVIEAHPTNTNGIPSIWTCNRSMIPSLLIAGGLSPRSASAVGETLKNIPADRDCTRVVRALGRRARSMLWKAYSVFSEGQTPRFSEPVLVPKVAPHIVFVFSGQGPQHWNTGREMFRTCAPFHDTVVDLDRVYARMTGKSLITDIGLLDGSDARDSLGDLWPISATLPALTILQIALVDTLRAIGVKPDVVVDHSAGETGRARCCSEEDGSGPRSP